ncbi:DUF5994 family protein [Streptomyces sp. NPDC060223]|uniref:DUF5994 family protein n=1 Tax=unclassified Streptomyces TaxID=2593676 RepID=UPI003632B84C
MSATTDHPPLRIVPYRVPAARLALKPVGASQGPLDGAWWPRSRDLTAELSTLAEVLDPLWGRITRIAVNPTHWPFIPRMVPVNGHAVKIGWFTRELDPHKIMLLSGSAGRWDLLVVPPETSAPAAARLMAAASTDTGPATTASALMAAEPAVHDSPEADRDQDSEGPAETMADEEGHSPYPAAAEAAAGRRRPLIGL